VLALSPGGQGGGRGQTKFYPNFYYFFLGAHAQFGNPTTTLSVMAVERKKERKKDEKREKRKEEKKSMIIVVPSCLKDADGTRTRSDQFL
jgi:hypothetical protein